MNDLVDNLAKFALSNRHVCESVSLIEKAFNQYGPNGVCLSFNGGKDCTALLHLVHCVSMKLFKHDNTRKLKIFYVELPNRFEEELRFINESIARYNLDLIKYTQPSIRESLFKFKNDYPLIKAIFIGTRSVDLKPNQTLDTFHKTDDGWPEFVRVNPILNWSYHQVWDFLLGLNVPYCDLYREGYSSLGTSNNTCKNSSLLVTDKAGKKFYLPAWKLEQSGGERQNRLDSS